MSTDAPVLAPEIVAALVAEEGSRERAATRLGLTRRTFFRRLSGHANELSALATAHGWPLQTSAATEAAARLAAERRARPDAA